MAGGGVNGGPLYSISRQVSDALSNQRGGFTPAGSSPQTGQGQGHVYQPDYRQQPVLQPADTSNLPADPLVGKPILGNQPVRDFAVLRPGNPAPNPSDPLNKSNGIADAQIIYEQAPQQPPEPRTYQEYLQYRRRGPFVTHDLQMTEDQFNSTRSQPQPQPSRPVLQGGDFEQRFRQPMNPYMNPYMDQFMNPYFGGFGGGFNSPFGGYYGGGNPFGGYGGFGRMPFMYFSEGGEVK